MSEPSLRARRARVFAALVALGFVLAVPFAGGDARGAVRTNPFEAKQRELAGRAAALGKKPEGVLPLLELFRAREAAPIATTRAILEQLATSPKLSLVRRGHVGALLARARLSAGDALGASELVASLGYVTTFRVAGPFDNEGKAGFARDLGPEVARRSAYDAAARFPGKEREVGYRVYPDVSHFGYVDFDAIFRPFENVCAVAETAVKSDRAAPLLLHFGGGGATKVYWNGEPVLVDEAYRQPYPDRHVVAVRAQPGVNRVLVKSCVTESTWGFYLRVTDGDGRAPAFVSYDAEDPSAPAPFVAETTLRAPESDLAALDRAASGARAKAIELERLARLLAWTGADDPAVRKAKELATRAADDEPTVARLTFAAELADERGEGMRFAAKAAEIAPNDPAALLFRARVLLDGPEPDRAFELLDRIPAGRTESVEAEVLRAKLHSLLVLPRSAERAAERAAELAPDAHRFLVEAARHATRTEVQLARRREAIAQRYDDVGSRRAVLDDAIQRGERGEALAQLAVLRDLERDRGTGLVSLARSLEGLGQNEEAAELYARALALVPEDAGVHVAKGEFLLRLGQSEAAIESLRRALALRPQDAETREKLARLRPEARADEGFAATSEAILARRVATRDFPMTVLQDLTVNTVYASGLGSSFHQLAVQIHDDEGARAFTSQAIAFDPAVQRVDVRTARVHRGTRVLEANRTYEQQLGEPWYRVYYDTRALVVVFPTLEPGDVVEIAWRVEDVAPRNLFADYYGDLSFLDRTTPVKHVEYVLLAPKSRQLYFNEPRLPGLRHEHRVEGDVRIDRFVADDVPAIRAEVDMPGMTEVGAYVHVSTYRSWEDVGRWYWGLVADQLVPDDALRRTVRETVAGATTTEEKVRRIYRWVVENTRYVALEFGIHGFKPYRVTQIVRRGFGDCKDKASLLYAMLEEAGIDARLVLIRTRRNGDIPERPASLAVFDHAIAYVPELDLFLDGTAEDNGARDLPSMDQGVVVLVVGPDGAELKRTPELPADANVRTRELDVALGADGSATVEEHTEVRGDESSNIRRTFRAEGTRRERLENALRESFPGLDLERFSFDALEELDAPVRYAYRARVPELVHRADGVLRAPPSTIDGLLARVARRPTRRYPLELGARSTYREERRYRLPTGTRLRRLPEGGAVRSDFGSLAVEYESRGDVARVKTELVFDRMLVSPEEYPRFRSFVESADALLRERIEIEGGGR